MPGGLIANSFPRKNQNPTVRLKILQNPVILRYDNQGEGEFPLSDKQERDNKLNVLNSMPEGRREK